MLVLSRNVGQQIVIDDRIRITVLEICGSGIRMGFEAPAEVQIHREEVQRRLDAQRADRHPVALVG